MLINKQHSRNIPAILIIFSFLIFATESFAADYISVKKDGVNIRSGPGTSNEILWEVFKDFPLEVVQKKGKWAVAEAIGRIIRTYP